MVSEKDVVITGIGIVSPIGVGTDSFWNALIGGESGIRDIPYVVQTQMPRSFGGTIPEFDAKAYVRPRKTLKVMCRELQTAFSASVLASQQSGVEDSNIAKDRIATVFGSEMLYGDPDELQPTIARCIPNGVLEPQLWGQAAMREIFPLWMLKYLPNMAACHVGIALGALGPNNTIVMGDTSGLSAVGESISVIQRNHADVVVACSTGTRISLPRLLYSGSIPYASRRANVADSCRPFAADRDGFVGGEGAAAVVLESREHALQRGAKPIARIAGYANRFGRPQKREQGSLEALQMALSGAVQNAGVKPQDVGIAVCHAMGDVHLDAIDAAAHAGVLPHAILTAPKGAIGHLGGGCGIMEMAIAALSLQNSLVPPTINGQHKAPEFEIDLALEARESRSQYAIQSNFTSSGNAAAIVLQRL